MHLPSINEVSSSEYAATFSRQPHVGMTASSSSFILNARRCIWSATTSPKHSLGLAQGTKTMVCCLPGSATDPACQVVRLLRAKTLLLSPTPESYVSTAIGLHTSQTDAKMQAWPADVNLWDAMGQLLPQLHSCCPRPGTSFLATARCRGTIALQRQAPFCTPQGSIGYARRRHIRPILAAPTGFQTIVWSVVISACCSGCLQPAFCIIGIR